ncbi:hypothetical protein JCM19046_3548 [Bacillus sp. JCM 19046]|nr:hypothetical protein JCM19045_4227 [Bacillus sp. JCM 19045]GAF18935.1 hypothetical protein JCM19046_3548 [Bacillus sp. JCM 19046]
MNDIQVKKARREKQKSVVGLIGPSGSGKTVSGLRMAYGMMKAGYPDANEEEIWEKIGVVDTEHGRSKLYWQEQFGEMIVGDFLHIEFNPPYTTDRYNFAVSKLKEAGAEVIIIDSLSHNWSGEGGIVEVHDNMSGNSFQNWGKLAKETHNIIKTLTRNNVHIISTLRTKQEYAIETNDKGRPQPVKVGTKPVQKDELEYEFMLNFNIDMDNVAVPTKDNTRLFKGKPHILDEEAGAKLYKWLEHGVDVKAEQEAERLSLVEEVKTIVGEDEELKKALKELEAKAQMDLKDFSIKFLNGAINRLQTQK